MAKDAKDSKSKNERIDHRMGSNKDRNDKVSSTKHPTTMQIKPGDKKDQPKAKGATTMRAAQGKDYGAIDEMLSVEDGVPVPLLSDVTPKERKNKILVRTLAVSLAPGDCRVLSGWTKPVQGPPSFPYVPGGDVCGVVEEIPNDAPHDLGFEVGDTVTALFNGMGPLGGLGEYAIIHTNVCARVPSEISPEGAAALASGAIAAVNLAKRIKPGERVLILGAGGGIGSHLCQLARLNGASYVAGVAKETKRLVEKPISINKAVDYTKEDPWSVQEWIDNPFDVIFDLASGGWLHILEAKKKGKPLIVKTANEGGRVIATVPDEPKPHIHSVLGLYAWFLWPSIPRTIYTSTVSRWRLPKFTFAAALWTEEDRTNLKEALNLASEGKLVPCIDPSGPFPFTTEGVRGAFKLQESRHVRGKAVIHVADK